MARTPSILESQTPKVVTRARPLIGHVQLRDLLVCDSPRILKYVQANSIVEHNIDKPNLPRQIAKLSFNPITLSSLKREDNTSFIAAGGQDAEVHLSLHQLDSPRPIWQSDIQLHGSINNSVLLTPRLPSPLGEPRLAVSNNDQSVRFYNVPIHASSVTNKLHECGTLEFEAPVNYCALSPDASTILAVGDSNRVSLAQIRGSTHLSFESHSTFILPTPSFFVAHAQYLQPSRSPKAPFRPPTHLRPRSPPAVIGSQVVQDEENTNPTALTASFSADFSSSGLQFSVASQEGLVAVYDVRSSRVMKVFETSPRDALHEFCSSYANEERGSGSGWITDLITHDPFVWTSGYARVPGWSVRCVKFGGSVNGKETMSFTEHADFLHVVDARTFEREEIVHVRPPPLVHSRGPRRRTKRRSTSHRLSPNSTRPGTAREGQSSGQTLAEIIRALERDAVERAVSSVGEEQQSSSSSSEPQESSTNSSSDGDFIRTIASLQNNMHALLQQLQDAQASSEAGGEGDVVRVLRDAAAARSRSSNVSPTSATTLSSSSETLLSESLNEEDLDRIVGSSSGRRWRIRDGVIQTRRLSEPASSGDESGDEGRGTPMQIDVEEDDLDDSLACEIDDDRERRQIEEEAILDRGTFDPDSEDEEPEEPGEGSSTSSSIPTRSPRSSRPLDLAGLCYDPSGANIYVASTEGIGEWGVREAGSRWFWGGAWA